MENTYRVLSFTRDVVIKGEEGQGGFAVPSFSYHDETKKEVKLDNGITKYVPKYAPLKSFQDVVVQSWLLHTRLCRTICKHTPKLLHDYV